MSFYNEDNDKNIWFDKKYLKSYNNISPILLDNLYGYVLPHASIKYTNSIMLHTFRFVPKTITFNKVVIFYYPASEKENVYKKYYHEYYTVLKTTKYLFKKIWKMSKISKITFIPFNVRDSNKNEYKNIKKLYSQDFKNIFTIISSDFSHFLPFEEAIEMENKAAHALLFKHPSHPISKKVVDHWKTFELVYHLLPPELQLQWVGRTRSPGKDAVGYLSFLIVKHINKINKNIDGLFVTCYDEKLNTRECLGKWFGDKNKYTLNKEKLLLKHVFDKAQTTSRLTGGRNLDIPVKYCIVTYLYKDNKNDFIRGWHGVLKDAFYLPEVFLENTFENGHWITENDDEWIDMYNIFDMEETFDRLEQKSGISLQKQKSPIFYSSSTKYLSIP